eukprot:s3271_g4.t1
MFTSLVRKLIQVVLVLLLCSLSRLQTEPLCRYAICHFLEPNFYCSRSRDDGASEEEGQMTTHLPWRSYFDHPIFHRAQPTACRNGACQKHSTDLRSGDDCGILHLQTGGCAKCEQRLGRNRSLQKTVARGR